MGREPAGVDVFECPASDLVGKDFILTFCFVLPLRVSPDSLRAALHIAIEQKMRKAGARRLQRLEYHVPHAFSPDQLPLPPRPGEYDESQPCFMHGLPRNIAAYFRGADCPRSLSDALRPGTPMVHVQATTLKDATLVGLTAPHIMFDVHGAKLFLEAWTSTLRGELDSVVPAPVDFVPLSRTSVDGTSVGMEQPRLPEDEPIRGFFALGLLATLQFVISLVWRMLWDPHETEILVRVPKAWLQQQKDAVMAELNARGRGEWVSTSDVLLAWKKLCRADRS